MPYHDLPTATALSLVMVVLAFDCDYNRSTTEDKALFFNDSESLRRLVESQDKSVADKAGRKKWSWSSTRKL